MPHQVRYALYLHLDLEERQLHVIAPDVGGGFGIKNIVYPEEIAVAAVARHLRYPLRWIEDRREPLLSSIHCRYTVSTVQAYADANGRVLGLVVEGRVVTGGS